MPTAELWDRKNRKLPQYQPPSPSVPHSLCRNELCCAKKSALWENFSLGKRDWSGLISAVTTRLSRLGTSLWFLQQPQNSWKLLKKGWVTSKCKVCAQPVKNPPCRSNNLPLGRATVSLECAERMWLPFVGSFLQPFSPQAQPKQRAKALELIGFLKLLIPPSLPASSVCLHSPGII